MSRKVKAMSWLIALCGLWEAGDIAAIFVPGFGTVPAFVWNHIATGVILVIAGARAARARDAATARRMAWISAIAGAWLIIAAFVFGGARHPAGLWNDVVVGVVVVILSVTSGLLLRRM
jgi:hypothetical protein